MLRAELDFVTRSESEILAAQTRQEVMELVFPFDAVYEAGRLACATFKDVADLSCIHVIDCKLMTMLTF
jgi:hypothetical protein